LKLLKELISTNKVDTTVLRHMLKTEKRERSELEEKYHRLLEERTSQIEAQKN
jgi:hypothetical protein